MARSRGGSSRPTISRSAPTQSRSAHTAAPPAHAPQHQQPNAYSHPQTQQQQPGLFSQMASTAAGVAVGSTIGHTLGAGITSMFGGSSAPAEQQQAAPPVQAAQYTQQQQGSAACDVDARNFTRCLGDNDGNMQICDFYLQQLKACQEASRQY